MMGSRWPAQRLDFGNRCFTAALFPDNQVRRYAYTAIFKPQRRAFMALKPGPKPIADSTGKPDQRRRDNKTTPGNTPELKPSKSSNPPKKNK